MGAAAIPIAMLAVSAVGTGASIYQGRKQADQAEDAADAQAKEQKRLRSELEERQRQEEASRAAKEARMRQRAAGGGLGRRSTQFTGPLGLPELGTYTGATKLGGGA